MSDPVSRLLAAIAEREKRANDCLSKGRRWWDWQQLRAKAPWLSVADSVHIALNDPTAVLRRCAADKALLDLHGPNDGAGDCQECFSWVITGQYTPKPFPCPTVLLLAQGYGISVEEETTGE